MHWQGRCSTNDPILFKDNGLIPVIHARGTSGSAMRICCIGDMEQVEMIGKLAGFIVLIAYLLQFLFLTSVGTVVCNSG